MGSNLAGVLGWLRRALRPRRRLTITREGKLFLLATVGIGFAAVNTGNNLLYLVLGWMLSLIAASGALSEASLRGLAAERRPAPRIFAGRPFLMGVSLENVKGLLPSFSIEVEDLFGNRPLDKKCYFLKIPAGRRQETSYRHTFARRGLYRFQGLRLSTKFPFALFRKSLDLALPCEVLVYPAIHPVALPAAAAERGGEEPCPRAGRRGELLGLREFRHGDDYRDVHWRTTARQGRLMVREYEDESRRRATILLDNALPAGASDEEREALERAVSLAASLAVAYAARTYSVGLRARGAHVPAAAGPAQVTRILRALALLPAADESAPFSAGADPSGENVLVACRGRAVRPPGVSRVLEA